jgi:hypothetical protein
MKVFTLGFSICKKIKIAIFEKTGLSFPFLFYLYIYNLTRAKRLNSISYAKSIKHNIMIDKKNDLFFVNSWGQIEYFYGKDLIYLLASGNYTEIHLSNQRMLMVTKPLIHCSGILDGYIYKIGDCMALNLAKMQRYVKKDRTLFFTDGSSLQMTCRQDNAFGKHTKSLGIKI